MRNFEPRPYQIMIAKHFMENDRNGVFAAMGMGKTSATLMYLKHLLEFGLAKKILIIAPLRVAMSVWPMETKNWKQFSDLNIVPIVGLPAKRIKTINSNCAIHTINYEQLDWLVSYFEERGGWPFDTVILDESTKVKGFRTRQGTKNAKALSKVIHKTKHVKELTGSPVANGLKDLWGQAWMLDKGKRLEDSYGKFTNRWFKLGFDGFSVKPLPNAEKEIREAVRDLYLTVDPKDYFDLKEPIVNNLYVPLPESAFKYYKEMEEVFFVTLARELKEHKVIEAVNAAVLTQKLLQISSGCLYTKGSEEWVELHDEKIKALEDVIEEASGAPVLVAYYYKFDKHRILKHFGSKARELDKNPTTIDKWNNGEIPILLAHPQSAGHGLNLQHGGNILAFFGVDWNLEYRLQMLERIGPVRQVQSGYNRNVFVHNILSNAPIDSMVLERITTKKSIQDILLAELKNRKIT